MRNDNVMLRRLIEDLHQHFEMIENPTNPELHFLRDLTEAIEYFPIMNLERTDLIRRGFDGQNVDDCTMAEITHELRAKYYHKHSYWQYIDKIATEMGIPKIESSPCPECHEPL